MAAPQYLLDTAILMHLIRDDDVGKFANASYQLTSQQYRPFISIVVRGEIKSFLVRRGWNSAKIAAMDSVLDNVVTIDITYPELIDAYAAIDNASLLCGRRMGKNDLWIAATAKAISATLITTDPDFDHLVPTYIHAIRIDPEKFRVKPINDQ